MEKISLKKTPLFDLHGKAKAKMVDFAGYNMPLMYQGILGEHTHTRQAASLFDVSHMGQVSIHHPDGFEAAARALEAIVPSSLTIMQDGTMKYSVLLNDQGGIVDDLIVIRRSNYIYLIVNAARIQQDLAHLQQHLSAACTIIHHEDMALIALQGPKSAEIVQALLPSTRLDDLAFMQSREISIERTPVFLMRSGYTGEDGFELSVPRNKASKLTQLLMSNSQLKWAGLGARDSLRLEAGLCLYGHDLDEQTSPVEAGLQWVIAKERRAKPDFLGGKVIVDQLTQGPQRQRVGLLLKDRLPAREGAKIINQQGEEIGYITSGTFSPALNKAVAMGYVAKDAACIGNEVNIIIREKNHAAQIVKLPFVPHHYYKGKGS